MDPGVDAAGVQLGLEGSRRPGEDRERARNGRAATSRTPRSSTASAAARRVHRVVAADRQDREVGPRSSSRISAMSPNTSVSPGVVDAEAVLELEHEPGRLAEVQRTLRAAMRSPAECIAGTIVTLMPAASTVPPLFIPMTSSASRELGQPVGSARGRRARRARRRATTARRRSGRSARGSRSSTSHRRPASSAACGLFGLPYHGSTSTSCPPGVAISTHRVAVPRELRVAPDRHRSLLRRAALASSRGAHYRRAARPGRGYTPPVPAEQIADEPRVHQLDAS